MLTDPSGRICQYAYDGTNRLTTYTDPAGKVTTYAYDTANRLTQITDPLGNVTKIVYGLRGASAPPWGSWPIDTITRVTNPAAGTGPTTRYEVCRNGEPGCPDGHMSGETIPRTYVTDPNGNVTTYYTDGAGRVTQTKDPLRLGVDVKGANIGVTSPSREGWEDRRHGLLLPLSRSWGSARCAGS